MDTLDAVRIAQGCQECSQESWACEDCPVRIEINEGVGVYDEDDDEVI